MKGGAHIGPHQCGFAISRFPYMGAFYLCRNPNPYIPAPREWRFDFAATLAVRELVVSFVGFSRGVGHGSTARELLVVDPYRHISIYSSLRRRLAAKGVP